MKGNCKEDMKGKKSKVPFNKSAKPMPPAGKRQMPFKKGARGR